MNYMDKRLNKCSLFVNIIIIFLNVAFCLIILFSKRVFEKTDAKVIYGILCDAFFVPGIITFCISLLVKVSEGDFFDGVTFGLKRAFFSLIPGARLKKEENYADYKERRKKSRNKNRLIEPLLIGLAFIIVSIVFLILFIV